MSVTKEILVVDDKGLLNFGDYTLPKKTKKENFEFEGDIYKVKTFKEITKLEKNGMLVYESVPGSSVMGFKQASESVTFQVESQNDVQITLELEPSQSYEVHIDGGLTSEVTTNLGGKMSVNVELNDKIPANIEVIKK